MSIAWGSLVLLVVLLPGVLFFVGTYLPEKFTREAEARSPLGHLTGALLIALVVHGLAYSLLTSVCVGRFPCIDIQLLIHAASVDPKAPEITRRVAQSIQLFHWWILLYVLASSSAGGILGFIYGKLASGGRIRGLSRHWWVYDLSVDGLTYAYVLTHVKHEERILMYKGFLRAFGLQQDGRFSYIVLRDVTRMYLRMPEDGSVTSGPLTERVIGASSPGAVAVPNAARPRKRLHSLFVIEGEDIANAVFDVLETDAAPVNEDVLHRLIREEGAKIGLSESLIEEILRDT